MSEFGVGGVVVEFWAHAPTTINPEHVIATRPLLMLFTPFMMIVLPLFI
jgi:hypothetical protein